MKKTIMIDLDGTIMPYSQENFTKVYFGALCKKAATLGYEPEKTVKDIWTGTKAMITNDGQKYNGEVFWEVFRGLNEGKPDIKELCDEFYSKEFDGVRACLEEKRDCKELFSRLKEKYDIILSTNPLFPENAVETRLRWVGLTAGDFLLVTHYFNSKFCKPNPRYFNEILEKTGKNAADCVIVGNSVSEDFLPAKKLGIKSILVTDYLENPENLDYSDAFCAKFGELEEKLAEFF